MNAPRHFLDLDRFDTATLRRILDRAVAMKRDRAAFRDLLRGRTLAMIFEKPSTRTRVSFEVGMRQLGGDALVLKQDDMQLGRGETVADTARVLSRYVDAIMVRTGGEERLRELAAYASVPVINGLTNESHPCQIMADVLTYEEHRGPIAGRVVAWSGDGNNVAASWVHAAVRFGFELRVACPDSLRLPGALMDWAVREGGRVFHVRDAAEAARGADCVVTDAWASMNHVGAEKQARLESLAPYQVNDHLMGLAKPDALFMHCLPAHRGEEMTDSVIDGPQSVVWDEAENRLHAQKAILAWCLEA
ncbi:ornithine carbamoyltransferase [Azospirillum sp. ST 5-10]|uniref:ornithine carbamoyltransferase n=1 Tax=unclassified Azospirillum TaxID=2630922 RepID=UPI003F4A099C